MGRSSRRRTVDVAAAAELRSGVKQRRVLRVIHAFHVARLHEGSHRRYQLHELRPHGGLPGLIAVVVATVAVVVVMTFYVARLEPLARVAVVRGELGLREAHLSRIRRIAMRNSPNC